MSKETGGYAFPIPDADFQVFQPKTVDEFKRIMSGMTLRDYFAAKAMQGWLASYGDEQRHPVHGQREDEVAEISYKMADAMLKARGVV